MDLPINSMVIFNSYVKLPEGKWFYQNMGDEIPSPGRFDPFFVIFIGKTRVLQTRGFGGIWGPPIFIETQLVFWN